MLGKILKSFFVFILIIILILAGGAYYLYNYYVFKTVSICTSKDIIDDGIFCQDKSDCLDKFQSETDVPDFFKSEVQEVLNNAIICEDTCKIKKVYVGENCEEGDDEQILEIRGKDGVKLFLIMKDNLNK